MAADTYVVRRALRNDIAKTLAASPNAPLWALVSDNEYWVHAEFTFDFKALSFLGEGQAVLCSRLGIAELRYRELQACLKTLCDVGAEIAKALNDALASMRISVRS